MPAALAITYTDCLPADLKALAKTCKRATHARRLRALAAVLEGARPRAAIATRARVGLQTLCAWVHRYHAGGPSALRSRPRRGRPSRLTAAQKEQVRAWLDAAPGEACGGRSVWTLARVRERIRHVFQVLLSGEGVRYLLRALGFRKLSPRPIHPKADPAAQDHVRRNFRTFAASVLPEGIDLMQVDVWHQDEARVGQKGMLSRVWARTGTRPRVPRDHRYGYGYLFSAICPMRGVAVGHVCERANTDEMNRHLQDVCEAVPAGRHALMVLDGAGWHRAKALNLPANVSLLIQPAYSPELNPVEQVFLFLKSNYFANRVFATVTDIKDAVHDVWSQFAQNPDRITSIGTREWLASPTYPRTPPRPPQWQPMPDYLLGLV